MCSIILAAGKGTRLKSSLPKVMHEILGYPLIFYPLSLVGDISRTTIVVVGHGRETVTAYLGSFPVTTVVQEPQLGTGHAILLARHALTETDAEHILILPGDMPLIRENSLKGLMDAYFTSRADVGVLTARIAEPHGYGRIIRNDAGRVQRIVEEQDASAEQRRIDEINTGVYIIRKQFLLASVERLCPDNAKGEFYLTDVVAMAGGAESFMVSDPDEAHGINSRDQLCFAQARMQQRINRAHMEAGVTFMDPDTAWISPTAVIGQDVEIWPNVHILGQSSIETGVRVMPGVWIRDSAIGASSTLGIGSIIEGTPVEKESVLAPYTRISRDA
ncbi:MAG TPA: NTP transferase domain-containing protein [Deltaproteobacteria bacterium]|nr:NTP transferase domain-containing protein [Deltaproteobacteria bacterium]